MTGRDNRNTLATLDYCEEIARPVWIRHVLVPGFTLLRERLEELAAFLKPYRCIRRIDLLPYHKLGAYKWEQLRLTDTLRDVPEPSQAEIQMAEALFGLN